MGIVKKIKEFKWGYILLALISGAVGTCLFVYNNTSIGALAIAIGVTVILASILLAVLAFADRSRGFMFGVKVSLAVIMLISGVVAIVATERTMYELVGLFGLVFIMDGAYKMLTSAMSRRYRFWFWWLLLIASILLLAGGYVTVRYLTLESPITVYMLGSLFVIDAIANLFCAFCSLSGDIS